MSVYTFVGTKLKEDWSINTIHVKDVNGVVKNLHRGDSADLSDDDVKYLSHRFVLKAGTGQTPDPIVNPTAGPAGAQGAQGVPGIPGPAGLTLRGPWAPQTAYAIHDVVTYQGQTYVATAAFTSGATFTTANWQLLAARGGAEVAYAEITAPFTQLNPVANTAYDVTGLAVTFTADGNTDYMLEAFLPGVAYSAGGAGSPDVNCWLLEGANILQAVTKTQVAANKAGDFAPKRRLRPTNGAHTYKIQIRSSVGAAGQSLYANADPLYPAFLRAFAV